MTDSEYFNEIQKISISKQDDVEHVSEEYLMRAYVIINNIIYKNKFDVFLGCAALNLINTFANQKERGFSYLFKEKIGALLDAALQYNEIKLSYDDEKSNRMVYFQFYNFQFSFFVSYVFSKQLGDEFKDNLVWDGIRKQKCAITIFNYALNNDLISHFARNGELIYNVLKNEEEDFFNGKYKFINKRLVKIETDDEKLQDKPDAHLSKLEKNYYRENLRDCKNKMVALVGKFAGVYLNYATFTQIKPYMQGQKTYNICDHINIFLTDLRKKIPVDILEEKKRYIIIGTCISYGLLDMRFGVNLEGKKSMIVKYEDRNNISPDILELCYSFDEGFIKRKKEINWL